MKTVQSYSKLIDRSPYSKWESEGKHDLAERALAETRRILETHRPKPISQKVSYNLRKIFMDADNDWGVKIEKPLWEAE